MADPALHCNGCWTKAQVKAFKTACDHCYCESCAEQLLTERRRRCAVCSADVGNLLEFQVVGQPILDDQLVDVRATLQAIAVANGACSLDSWLSQLHRFERVQLALWGARQGQASLDNLREAEERERALAERDLQNRQTLASLEHECEQLRKERDIASNRVQELQSAADEKARQADNWRAMYESLKTGNRVSLPGISSRSGTVGLHGEQHQQALLPVPNNKMMRASTASFASDTMENQHPNHSMLQQGLGNNGMFPNRSRSASTLNGAVSDHSAPFLRHSSTMRPMSRDPLGSLLNRSIQPRSSVTFSGPSSSSSMGGVLRPLGPPPSSTTHYQQQLSEPVRSTYFAPSSMRAVSPSMSGLGRPPSNVLY